MLRRSLHPASLLRVLTLCGADPQPAGSQRPGHRGERRGRRRLRRDDRVEGDVQRKDSSGCPRRLPPSLTRSSSPKGQQSAILQMPKSGFRSRTTPREPPRRQPARVSGAHAGDRGTLFARQLTFPTPVHQPLVFGHLVVLRTASAFPSSCKTSPSCLVQPPSCCGIREAQGARSGPVPELTHRCANGRSRQSNCRDSEDNSETGDLHSGP